MVKHWDKFPAEFLQYSPLEVLNNSQYSYLSGMIKDCALGQGNDIWRSLSNVHFCSPSKRQKSYFQHLQLLLQCPIYPAAEVFGPFWIRNLYMLR